MASRYWLCSRLLPALLVGCALLMSPHRNLADEALLPPDHGYMLIRLKLTARERVAILAMSNVDTDGTIRIRGKSFDAAGVNAWIALVPMPGGRYFMSEYQPMFGIVGEEAQSLDRRHQRADPSSEKELLQIVPGVVNYVGDWEMRVRSSQRMQLNPVIEFEKTTLERFLSDYPEHAKRYPIYLSPMGQDAVALEDLVKAQNQPD